MKVKQNDQIIAVLNDDVCTDFNASTYKIKTRARGKVPPLSRDKNEILLVDLCKRTETHPEPTE